MQGSNNRRTIDAASIHSSSSTSRSKSPSRKNMVTAPEMKGWLFKRGGQSSLATYQERFFILIQDKLHYYKQKNQIGPSGTIPVRNILYICATDELPSLPKHYSVGNGFTIDVDESDDNAPQSRTYYLFAKTPKEKDDWISIIQESIDYHTTDEGELPSDNANTSAASAAAATTTTTTTTTDDNAIAPLNGFLQKTGPSKSSASRYVWRYFNYDDAQGALFYYKSRKDKQPLGYVPVKDIVKVGATITTPTGNDSSSSSAAAATAGKESVVTGALAAGVIPAGTEAPPPAAGDFHVATPTRVYQLRADSETKRRWWVKQLELRRREWERQRRMSVQQSAEHGLFFESYLQKRNPHVVGGWKTRWFVLRSHKVMYFKDALQTTSEIKTIYLSTVISASPVDDSADTERDKQGCAFVLHTRHRQYHLLAGTPSLRTSWLDLLQQGIKITSKRAVDNGPAFPLPERLTGWLLKRGPSSYSAYKERWFEIDKEELLYYKDNQLQNGQQPLGRINLREMTYIHTVPDQPGIDGKYSGCGFIIDTLTRVYYLLTLTTDDLPFWVDGLEKHRKKYAAQNAKQIKTITPEKKAATTSTAAATTTAAAAAPSLKKGMSTLVEDLSTLLSQATGAADTHVNHVLLDLTDVRLSIYDFVGDHGTASSNNSDNSIIIIASRNTLDFESVPSKTVPNSDILTACLAVADTDTKTTITAAAAAHAPEDGASIASALDHLDTNMAVLARTVMVKSPYERFYLVFDSSDVAKAWATAIVTCTQAYKNLPRAFSDETIYEEEEAAAALPKLKGLLHKKGHALTGWKERWFELSRDQTSLCYYKKKGDAEPAGAILLSSINFVKPVVGSSGCEFSVDVGSRVYELRAQTLSELGKWLNALEAYRVHNSKKKQ